MAERSKTYCPYPFISSHANVSGKFAPCCNADTVAKHLGLTKKEAYEYSLESKTYKEWFNDPFMKDLRQQFIDGKRPAICKVCWDSEDVGAESYRTNILSKFEIKDPLNPTIQYLDLKFSNECNLACRMCDYHSSNQIGKDMAEFEKRGWELPLNWERSPQQDKRIDENFIRGYSDDVLHEIDSFIPDLRYLKVTGGEPTISKQFNRIIDSAISSGHCEHIDLWLTTNATRLTPEYLQKLKGFKSIFLNISVDGYGTTYNYIRYPFKWENFEKRIEDIVNFKKSNPDLNFEFNFTCVPQLYNVENLPKLQEWVKRIKASDVFLQPQIGPTDTDHDWKWLPIDILRDSISKISPNRNSMSFINLVLKHIKDPFVEPVNNKQLTTIKTNTVRVDTVRKQNYLDSLEEQTIKWLEGIKVDVR
jgi:sulfatase maturation enzyme AslB (radical SAM superfamily)